jgi:peptidoglycan/xylan/chitin deacetylase (PgdA/CDA1 family)
MIDPADLFVLSSPLQYVNAVEWRLRTRERPADLALIGDREGGADTLDRLIERHPGLWREIFRHRRRPRSRKWQPRLLRDAADARHRASLERLARRLGPCATLVFGDYRNVSHRALVEAVPHEWLVLVDDGSVTPQVAAARAGMPDAADPGRFSPGWFRTAAARSAFGERAPTEPKSLTYFSIYASLIEPVLPASDALAPHALEAWRAETPPPPRGDEIWLIGSNHVEAGICSPEAYRDLLLDGLTALRREGRQGRAIYRPHRGEAAEKASALARQGGMELATATAPAEIAYLDAAIRPAVVAVVASSAADTLSVIDPELEIVRFALPPDYLKRQRDHILAVVSGHDAFNPRLRVISPRP